MRRAQLGELTTQSLVREFERKTIEQSFELDANDIASVTRLYWELDAISNELKLRSGDQRRALLALYTHPNLQVQLKAAHATLALEPELGRRKLKEIADSKHYPQAGDAGMSLWNLDRGVYKPV